MDISNHIINLVGGASNIASLDNCITRVRIIVSNPKLISQKEVSTLESLNAIPIINGNNVHIIVGTKSTEYKDAIAKAIKSPSNLVGVEGMIIKLCGGIQNIAELDNCLTRVRIIVHDPNLISQSEVSAIEKLDYTPVIHGKNVHIVVGKSAKDITSTLKRIMS